MGSTELTWLLSEWIRLADLDMVFAQTEETKNLQETRRIKLLN